MSSRYRLIPPQHNMLTMDMTTSWPVRSCHAPILKGSLPGWRKLSVTSCCQDRLCARWPIPRGYFSSLKSTKMSGWSVNDHKNYTNPPASGQKRPRSETGNKVTVVLGAQWGDEGKGKVVDLLATESDMVCRCQVLCTTVMLVPFFLKYVVCVHDLRGFSKSVSHFIIIHSGSWEL